MLTIFWMCLNMFEYCYSLLSMVEYSLWCWWCWMTNIDQWYFTPTHITISVTWGNASSASQNKKRQQRKGSKTKSMTASLGIGADTPGYEMKLAPAAVRSSFLFAEPKMRTLQKFVHMAGQERVDKKDPMSNSKFQRYYLHVLSWFCNWTCAGDFRKLPFIIWNLLPSWPWQEEEPVFEDNESWKSDPSTQYVHVCSRSSNTMYKHSWALSLDMLYTDVFRISRHCTRILTQITYQKSMQTPNWMVFLWVRWAWYPPFAKESILESFGDDRSPDGSPSNFWDEPTVLLDSTPASRRMSSRRTLRLGLTRV